jgi:hypothetical protein
LREKVGGYDVVAYLRNEYGFEEGDTPDAGEVNELLELYRDHLSRILTPTGDNTDV